MKVVALLVLVAVQVALVALVGLMALSRVSRRVRRWCCKHMDWHDGNGGPLGFDGASLTSRCSCCGQRVLQDSQGNWFLALVQDDDLALMRTGYQQKGVDDV